MDRRAKWLSAALMILALGMWAGCGPTKKVTDKKGPEKKDEHEGHKDGDEHGHQHPAHGPNGGHIADLYLADSKKVAYHAEWLYDDESGKVTVVLFEPESNKEVGTDAEELSLDVTSEGKTVSHKLKSANRTDGDKPKATRFELIDQPLVTYLSNDVLDAMIRVEIEGKEAKGKLVQHKH